jgi:hypothetical protein
MNENISIINDDKILSGNIADEVDNDDDDDDRDQCFYDSMDEPSFSGSMDDDSACEDGDDESKLENESMSQVTSSHVYYAVQFVNQDKEQENSTQPNTNNTTTPRIFINKNNAMKVCKQQPGNRRFNIFKSFEEAYAFSYQKEINTDDVPKPILIQQTLNIQKAVEKKGGTEKLPFPSVSKLQVNKLKTLIETNKIDEFKEFIISNPRLLISDGDSPVVVQQAFHYNCLHICAKSNRPEICDFILSTLSQVAFLKRLYISDSIDQINERKHHLIDLYLNMPDKGFNETSLHFGCKFGSFDVVKQLLSYEACDKDATNKFGKKPFDLICTKYDPKINNNIDKSVVQSSIESLFESCIFVPFYRDEEMGQCVIDKPSPKLSLIQQQQQQQQQPADSPTSNYHSNKSNSSSPLNTNTNIINNCNNFQSQQSKRKLAAYVGPISPVLANSIYSRLKSPASLRRTPQYIDIIRSDDIKGYERVIRQISDEMNVPCCEYWSFLNSYVTLKNKEGLQKLDTYLRQKRIEKLFDTQMKVAINIIKEDRREKLIIRRLEDLLNIIKTLKDHLDIKDNVLSPLFEDFLKKSNQTTTNDYFNCKISNDPPVVDENHFKNVNEQLQQYMTIVIELSKLDKTSMCYFNLYKTSKTVIQLLNCSPSFECFYLSPVFKSTIRKMNDIDATKLRLQQKRNDSDDSSSDDDEDNESSSSLSSDSDSDLIKFNKKLIYNDEEDDDDDNEKKEDESVSLLIQKMSQHTMNNSFESDDKNMENLIHKPKNSKCFTTPIAKQLHDNQRLNYQNRTVNTNSANSSQIFICGLVNSSLIKLNIKF